MLYIMCLFLHLAAFLLMCIFDSRLF